MADVEVRHGLDDANAVETDHPRCGDLAIIIARSPFLDDRFVPPAGYTLHQVVERGGELCAAASRVVVDETWIPSLVVAAWARAGMVEVRPRFFRRLR